MKHLLMLGALAVLAAPAAAAPCKDAKTGKFVKCPSTAPVKKAPCRNAKGKFIKCAA